MLQTTSHARLVLVILLLCSWIIPSSAVHAAPLDNPLPALVNLNPNYVYAGSGDFTFTLNGGNFVTDSVVRWEGLDLATTFLSSNQLTALVPAAQVASAGTISITVFNPAPGGGVSNPLPFTIRPLDTWLQIGLSGQTVLTVAADPANPLVLYAGTYSGVHKSTDGGSTWAASNNGLSYSGVYALAIHPNTPGTLYAGTWGGLFKSTNFGANWSPAANGSYFDIRDLVFDPTDPSTLYAATWGSGVIKVTNNGTSVSYTNYAMVRNVYSVAIDPANPLVLYAGTGGTYYGIFMTTNGGGNWNWMTTYLGNRLAPHPTTPNLVYAATNTGVLYTPNGGYTWFPRYTSASALAIAVDPLTPEVIYAGLPSNVIRSTNGGANWSTPTGIGGQYVLSLAFNPSQPADVYAGTNGGGIFRLHTSNPVPTLASLSPTSVPAGFPATTLTLNGTKFVRGAVVKWDGVPLATTYLSGGQLTALIPAAKLTTMQVASITVTNPAPGGGASNTLTFSITKHPLTLEIIQPAYATVGASSLELSLQGISFIPASLARWDDMELATTFISPTLLTATLPAANLSVAGVHNLTVSNPDPDGEISAALPFTVNNPLPTLTAFNPPNVLFNTSTFTLTLSGAQFIPGAQADWEGQALPTTYISPTQLSAVISDSLLLAGGSFPIRVTNPAPSLGKSASLIFNVYDPAPPTLSQIGPNYNFIGEPAFNLTISGTNILDGGALLWDGDPLAVISGKTATIPTSSLAATGVFTLSLHNPAPVEGESNGLAFTVHPTGQWFVKGQGGNYVLIDPELPSTLYLASGVKILRSNDRGSHWLEAGSGLPGSSVYRITYASAGATYPSALYASTESGVYKSTDHGASWASASTGLTALSVREIVVHPTDSQHLVAAVYGGGAYISLDGAASWSLVSTPAMTGADAVVIDPFDPDIIYVGTFAFRIFKSTDGGATWIQTFAGCNTYSMAISQHTPGLVLVGTNCGALLTQNGGLTWTTMTPGISDAVAFDPVQAGVMYASERVGKLWHSRDNGLTWQSLSNGLDSGEILTSVAVNPISPGVLFASGALTSYAMKLPTPQARLSAISPTQGTLGDPDLDLQVSGLGFTSEAVVRLTWPDASWQDLVTTFISPTRLTAVMTLATLNTGGSLNVSVVYANPGSGISNNLPFLVNYPIPMLGSLSPDSQVVGGPPFTLTVDGLGFASSSWVQWEGAALVTTYISATRLTAAVPATYLNAVGSAAITVSNPAPGGGTSNALWFTTQYPAPDLFAMDPISATIGSTGFTLTLNGANFIANSVVRWEGSELVTTYISPTQLTTHVSTAQLSNAGTFSVTIASPAPGGGVSLARTFTIYNPIPVLASISPSSVRVNTSGLIITIFGANFLPSTVAWWDGSGLDTTYISPTQLTVNVPIGLLLHIGTSSLAVQNPDPSLGFSQSLPFVVRPWEIFIPLIFR